MTIEKKVEEYLEHYNHNHDALGRFTFSGAIGSVISSARSARAKQLESRTQRDKDKLAYQKIKNKARQARLKLKTEKKVSKSKEKYLRAKGKAKSSEYLNKAKREKEKSALGKTYDRFLEVTGRDAETRNAKREQLRKDKAAEIKEAMEAGDIMKVMKYKGLMTTDEISTALNRVTANQNVDAKRKELVKSKVDKILGIAETASDYADRALKIKKTADNWKREKDKADLREKYETLSGAKESVMRSLLDESKAKDEYQQKATDAFKARKEYYNNPNASTKARNEKATSEMNKSGEKFNQAKQDVTDSYYEMRKAQNDFDTAKEKWDFESSIGGGQQQGKKKN